MVAVDRQRIFHKRDRLRQLRVFCQVAQMNSISRAAESLGLSQPGVSLHVRKLEYELEAVLFERRGPRIALTPAGERLRQIALPLVEAMDGMLETLAEHLEDPVSGDVHLTAGPSATAFVLPPFLKRFRDEYPGVRLRVTTTPVSDGLKLLSGNEADLVIGAEEPGTEDFVFCPVFSYNFVLITPEDHPLAGRESVDIREAAAWPAIVPPAGTYSRQSGERITERFGVKIKVAVEARGWGVIKEYVEAGLGISVVPDLCIVESDRLSVIPFGQYVQPRIYGVFTRRDKPLSPPAQRLVRLLAPDFPDPPGIEP